MPKRVYDARGPTDDNVVYALTRDRLIRVLELGPPSARPKAIGTLRKDDLALAVLGVLKVPSEARIQMLLAINLERSEHNKITSIRNGGL